MIWIDEVSQHDDDVIETRDERFDFFKERVCMA